MSKVWPSRRRAAGASHGWSRGTLAASRAKRDRPWNRSASTIGLSLRDGAAVGGHAAGLAAEDHHRLPVVVRGEGLQPKFSDQFVHTVLGGPDPLASQLDRGAVRRRAAFRSATDPVPGFEHHGVDASCGQPSGGGQTRQARADDDHLHVGHGALNRSGRADHRVMRAQPGSGPTRAPPCPSSLLGSSSCGGVGPAPRPLHPSRAAGRGRRRSTRRGARPIPAGRPRQTPPRW